MTLRELNEYRRLNLRYRRDKAMHDALTLAAYPSINMDGMPHGTAVGDKVGNLAAELADLAAQIDDERIEIDAMRPKVERYINAIEDGSKKMIFKLRFLYLMELQEIADAIGQDSTAQSIKQMIYRFVKENE